MLFYQDEQLTPHSNKMAAIPDTDAEPARPMKCSLPILLANIERPTCKAFDALAVNKS